MNKIPHTSGTPTGSSSIAFSAPVYIQSYASVVSQKEGDGPLGKKFDMVYEDPMFGADTWEAAESALQKKTAELTVEKSGLALTDIRMIFAGDLLAQTTASSFGTAGMGIPFYGLFGACSTMGEALSLGAMTVAAGYGRHVLCTTSSHFASAEKEFRFPLGYGSQRPLSASWTVTGSGACILGSIPPGQNKSADASAQNIGGYVKITGVTTGRLVDYGCRDSLNMGACMAPADVATGPCPVTYLSAILLQICMKPEHFL